MRLRSGPKLVFLLASLATGCVLAVAALRWDRLVEGWHLRRLHSRDLDVQAEAAARLGELRSRRAVERLVHLVERALGHPQENPEGVVAVLALKALARLGTTGVDAIDRASAGWDAWMRRGLLKLVLEEEALEPFRPLLARWIRGRSEPINHATLEALSRLERASVEDVRKSLPPERTARVARRRGQPALIEW